MDRSDIILDSDNDLLIQNGDLVVVDSNYQHIRHILESTKGEYKQFPTLGAGLTLMQNANITVSERKDINESLIADGYKASNISIISEGIEIEL